MQLIFSVFNRDLVYLGRYSLTTEGEEVTRLVKLNLNMLYHTKNKIGFARFIDGKQQSLETSTCSLGIANSIENVVADSSKSQQTLFVATDRGDILVVEVMNHRAGGEQQAECKIKGRLPASLSDTNDAINPNDEKGHIVNMET
jgi:hypothetical protein